MGLAVGQIAALINVFALIIVSIVDRAIEHIARNYATSRFQATGRAPVLHDSDTWLPNLPRSLVKYYKYPGMSLC